MAIASNLYADKVFAEHPIGLWSLDEPVDYGSRISEALRNMHSPYLWSISGGTAETFSETLPSRVFENSVINKIITDDIVDDSYATVTMAPLVELTRDSFDFDLGSFSIGSYIYPYGKTLTATIGYQYKLDGVWSSPIFTQFQISTPEQWSFVSETFDIPSNNFTHIRFAISVTYHGPTSGYQFLVHGLSLGQQSEQFNAQSLGIVALTVDDLDNPLELPKFVTDLDVPFYPANTYGLKNIDGYYLGKPSYHSSLCSINSDMPLVYGASSSTRLTKNENGLPSLIIPGLSFLNDSGRYLDLTFELWIKIQTIATEPTKIFGPIGSENGVYVSDAFLILKVGDNIQSYYVGEWDRPMLLAIRQSLNSISMVINGEEVISMSVITASLNLPEMVDNDGYSQDWIAFYCSDSVPQMNVDCIGVYPYIVPNLVEKRRWVYGQGVETPENIVGAAIGSSVAIDYTVANYAKNYTYPDIGRFQQGINENLLIENNAISLPKYDLPEIAFNNKTLDQWYAVVPEVDDTYGDAVNLKPNSSWSNTEGYMLFSKLNLLSQDIKAFYALFESNANDSSKQTLFYIENETTGDAIEISLEGTVVSYILKTRDVSGSISEDVIYSDSYHVPGDFLLAGISIDPFMKSFGGKATAFFGSKQSLKFYVGGSRAFSNTFSGKIYRVGFCTARNLQKISFSYTPQGIAQGYNALDSVFIKDAAGFNDDNSVTTTWESLADSGDSYFGNTDAEFDEVLDGGHVYSILVDNIMEHVASYTLKPKTYLGKFILDIAVNGYWQDYVPVSYFAKYVKDGTVDQNNDSNTYLDVDFIQFNISYPELNKFLGGKYDTSKSIVKTYVSFQYLGTNSSVNLSSFLYEEGTPQSGVIIPSGDWDSVVSKTKYEVVNDCIIYPPDGMDFGMLAMVLHVEIISSGYQENPIKIRSIELSSQALNAFVPNAIGTKHGALIYPYRKSAEYYDYKGRNPFSIYKGNMPYLYLTSHSGLRLRDLPGSNVIRGFSMPINKTRADYYKVGAMQIALRFDGETFNDYVTDVFEIEANGPDTIQHIKFYIERVDSIGKRARIYPIDANTGLSVPGVTFYINGQQVGQAVVNINNWITFGVSFAEPLDFSSNVGAIRVTGKVLFNNVSHYQITAADEASKTVYRTWSGVKTVNDVVEPWDYWLNGDPLADPAIPGSKWKDVMLVNSSNGELVSGETVYKKYTGTDKFTVDFIPDTGVLLRVNSYEYKFYDDVRWSSNIIKPV